MGDEYHYLFECSFLNNERKSLLPHNLTTKPNIDKGLGAIRAKIGLTSDVDKIFSKMYSQYVLFINKYS
jgi:hypothetical protein